MILSFSVTAIPNPSAVYCNKLGYDYEIEKTPQGETGKCIVKPRVELKAWDFFKGKVGKQYSYCAQNGYDIETEKIDKGTYSIEYAVCVSKKTFLDKIKPLFGISVAEERISMHELMKEKGESLIDAKAYIMEQEEGKNIKDDKPEKPLNAISETKGIESGGAEGNGLGNPPIGDPHSLFDWRNYSNKNWMTPVKNQGDCGSCWAFSAVGAVEAKFNIDYNDPNLDYDLSEQQLVSDGDSCCSGGGCDDGCNGGSPITALGYTRDTGIADEDCFSYLGCHSWTSSPYNCDVEYPCNLCGDWQDRAAKITNYHKVTPNTTAAYKQALMDYGPLSIAIDSGEMFTYYFGGIYDQSDANLTGLDHAIVLVGWNDTGSYWIVKNSWGTGWGDSGYAKMNYGDIEYQDYVYAVEDTIRPLNKQARLQSYLISPTSSINVTKNEFFNFSTGVNCINGYCGDVNATLTLPLSQSQPTTCSEIWGGDCSEGPPESFDNTFDNCSSGLGGDHSIDEVYLDKSGLEFGEEIEVICNVIIKGLNCGEAYTNDRLYIYYRNSPTGTWEKKHYVSQVYSCYNYSVKFVPDNVEGEHQVRCITGWLIVEGECGSGGYYDNDDANFSVYDYNSDKGKIPMNTGSPFYTISQNPSNCTNMTNQSTCNQTWIVNATGEINSSWLFYTIYESNLPDVETNETGKINVTIVDTPANTYNLSDYYPLNQGDTWTYSTIRDGYNETEIVLINGTETFGSVDAVKMYFYYGYYGWEYDALQWAPEGLMDYKWVYDNGTEYEVYSTPIMNAPVEMSTGQTHQDFANYTGYEEGNVSPAWTGNETTILTLLGIENITVPAGTFEALKFTCTNNWFDDDGCYGTDSAVNWLAYKIGIIREIGNESEYCPGDDLDVWNYSMELINATVGGVSYQNDKQQITNNYNALETAFKAENITSFMYHVSPEYFDECENYSNFRDNIQHLFDNYHDLGIDLEILNITISDSFAFVIINRNWSGKRNSDGITEQDTESFLKEIWKKENNNWTMYGNQGRSQVSASTGHNVNPWNDNYFLWMSAKSECDDKELIAANVTGPGITTVTLGKGGEDYFSNFSTIKPNIGDVYTFHLLYNDSYTEEINDNIESLVESGPNITYPQHMSTITKLEPIFTWTNASSAVNNQGHYFIKVSNSSDAEIWHINLPLTETSVQYNINGVAEEPLERGKNYWFEVFINDVYENFAYQRIFFNVSSDIQTRSINITLSKGWNLISIPLNLTNWTLPHPFKSIEGNYSKIFTYINREWTELKDNDEINETLGLWINMNENDTLIIEGEELNNAEINIKQGWNLIGYPLLETKSINEAFNVSKISVISMYNQSKWYSYNPLKPDLLNTLKNMLPGYGYWVKASEAFLWNMGLKSLNGTYNIVRFGSDHGEEFTSGIGYINFDGISNFTGEITNVSQGQSNGNAFDIGPVNGTYTISSNGKLTLLSEGDVYDSGYVSADSSLIVWAPVPGDTPYEEAGINVGIKQSFGMGLKSLNGTYNIVRFGSDHGEEFTSGIGYINFDGISNFTGEITNVSQGQSNGNAFDIGPVNGTYTISSNGKLTLLSEGGVYDNGYVSADGSLIVWAPVPGDTPYEETGITVAVKEGSGLGVQTLNGKYNAVIFGSDHATEFTAGIGYINFDGAASYTGEITQVSQGQSTGSAFDIGPVSGTYSVDSDGKLTLGDYDIGYVSADGSLVVWAPVPGDTPYEETGITIGVKN